MSEITRGRRFGVAALLTVAVTTAACGGGDGSGGSAGSGSIVISGSSTVEPISVEVASRFAAIEGGVNVSVDGPGTGDGFELFCSGQTDVSDASRPIKQAEIEDCEANGIEFIELKVAFDGIAVMGHADNPLDCLSFADLYALVGPESDDVDRWSDASALAAELGSDTSLPDLELVMSAPGEESGTFDTFIELVLEDIAEERDQEPITRLYSGNPNDNVILDGIKGAKGSFGWVGYAFASNATDVTLFDIDGGDGSCVAPTAESIADGSYPISRALYLYVSKRSADERPEVARFIDFYLNDAIDAVTSVGYVSLPDDQLDATRTIWADRVVGTQV